MNKRAYHQLKRAAAYHEAGHALACHLLGFKIAKVTIVSDEATEGKLVTRRNELKMKKRKPVVRWHAKVVMLLAGAEAQNRFRPGSVHPLQCSRDMNFAVAILVWIHRSWDVARTASILLQVRARSLVRQPANWRMIQRLAKALFEKGTLTGAEVEAVFRA